MEKKKIRFNVIDSVIIIAILAVAAALVVRELFGGAMLERNTDGTPVSIEMNIKVSNIQKASQDYIKVGDIVNNAKGEHIARITKADFTPAEGYYVTETGDIKKLDIPGRIDAYITVECLGRVSDDGLYTSDSLYIAVSQQFGIYTSKSSISGFITGIDYEEITTDAYAAFKDAIDEEGSKASV